MTTGYADGSQPPRSGARGWRVAFGMKMGRHTDGCGCAYRSLPRPARRRASNARRGPDHARAQSVRPGAAVMVARGASRSTFGRRLRSRLPRLLQR
jgi:hypothetical protein